MNELDVRTSDGRTLRVRDDGDPAGPPVLAIFGTPTSRVLPSAVARAATAHGTRTISYDRPGYGASTRAEGRNVADCAGDIRAIADALGVTRLPVWGISGGGPHALACAALLDGLVPAVAAIASVAPYGAPGLDWLDGMGEDNVEEFGAALKGPQACRALLETVRPAILAGTSEQAAEAMRSLLSSVDAAAFTGETAAEFTESTRVGIADGVDGWLDDDLAFVSDWGFGLTQIRTPTLIAHGREDRFVPPAHGEWLARAVPGGEVRIHEDEGHISIMANRLGEIYDWLLERL